MGLYRVRVEEHGIIRQGETTRLVVIVIRAGNRRDAYGR
jgi:hypothetical protein